MLHRSRPLLLAALLATAGHAHAQSPAPAAASSPAKKELVARVLQLQQPGIESLAKALAEQPASELLARAGPLLQSRVPPEQREAVAQGLRADAQRYVDEAVPLVRARAVSIAPQTVGALLEEKFSEEELRQVVAMMQSPVYSKFQSLGGDMQKVLADRLIADTRTAMEPKVRALEQAMAKRLGITAQAPAAPASRASARR